MATRGRGKTIYTELKKEFEAEQVELERRLEQSRIQKEEFQNQRIWVEWIKAHKNRVMEQDELSDKEKKDYLKTIVEQIVVELTEDRQHRLTTQFCKPIHNDAIKYLGTTTDGKKDYDVFDGETQLVLENADTNAPRKKKSKRSQS